MNRREQIEQIAKTEAICWGIGIVVMIVFMVYFVCEMRSISNEFDNTIKYDCRLAEISVDYPQQVKEQCRKLLK